MRVLGIDLKPPGVVRLLPVIGMGILAAGLAALLLRLGVISVRAGVALTLAVLGGGLAASCGVSIAHDGWRGIVISAIFVIVVATSVLWIAGLVAHAVWVID